MLKSAVGMAQPYVLTLLLQEVSTPARCERASSSSPWRWRSRAANLAGRCQDRLSGVKATALLGCFTLFGGLVVLNVQLHPGATVLGIVAAMIIIESGFMIAEVRLHLAAATALPRRRGLAAGVLNTSTDLGNALGLGLTAAVVGLSTSALHRLPADQALASGLRWVWQSG